MRTRIKICGITRQEDAQAATKLGVDALGFVFYPASSRALFIEQALALSDSVPAFITRVALFLNAEAEKVKAVVDQLNPELLQFHGTETPEYCRSFGKPYIKALALGDANDPSSVAEAIHEQMAAHVAAIGFLLDSHQPGEAGGTGKAFDWSQMPSDINRPVVLAGGLKPENVAEAVRQLRPFAVDVSSGVESAPGIKDADKLREFVQQVKLADES